MPPPPVVAGFSLRVKLFAPEAARKQDTPVRCFRVVASPHQTVRDFCQEASRIHAINYGQYVDSIVEMSSALTLTPDPSLSNDVWMMTCLTLRKAISLAHFLRIWAQSVSCKPPHSSVFETRFRRNPR